MSGRDRLCRRSERMYRLLLVAYPKRFRDAYGEQMLQVFQDSLRHSYERHTPSALVGFWIRTLRDLVVSAVAERKNTHVERTRPRDPGAAAVLSLLWMGLGHVYCGQWTRGWALVLLGAGWVWLFFSGTAAAGNFYVAATVLCLALQLWSAWNAYRIAGRSQPVDQTGHVSSRWSTR